MNEETQNDQNNDNFNDKSLIYELEEICSKGRSNDVEWRWHVGSRVRDAYENKELYSKGILKTISSEINISVPDLSRFKKFSEEFTLEEVQQKAQCGYTWSHFKIINDVNNDEVKKKILAKYEEEKPPKSKDLQKEIVTETDRAIDPDTHGQSSNSSENKSSNPSPSRPITRALGLVDKLGDVLSDIAIQLEKGVEFDSDKQQENYDSKREELKVRLNEIKEIIQKLNL